MSIKLRRRIALAVALLAAGGTFVANSIASRGFMPKDAENLLTEQIVSFAGVIGALLVERKLKDPTASFILAGTALCLGAWLPWLAIILDRTTLAGALANSIGKAAPALFAAGVAFVVTAAEQVEAAANEGKA